MIHMVTWNHALRPISLTAVHFLFQIVIQETGELPDPDMVNIRTQENDRFPCPARYLADVVNNT